jgi:hypothetical protein
MNGQPRKTTAEITDVKRLKRGNKKYNSYLKVNISDHSGRIYLYQQRDKVKIYLIDKDTHTLSGILKKTRTMPIAQMT